MIVLAATLIAPAATPLIEKNWNKIIVIIITINTNFVIELIPFNCLLSSPKDSSSFNQMFYQKVQGDRDTDSYN